MMTCTELLDYLSDYIDRNLDESLTAAAQAHLATCRNCRVVLDTTQRTLLLFREQGQRVMPLGRRQALYLQLRAAFLETSETL